MDEKNDLIKSWEISRKKSEAEINEMKKYRCIITLKLKLSIVKKSNKSFIVHQNPCWLMIWTK